MVLTQGEKMVWAAAFVHDFIPRLQNAPGWAMETGDRWNEYEVGVARSAAEVASVAVTRLRDAGKTLIGAEDVDKMLLSMLGEE